MHLLKENGGETDYSMLLGSLGWSEDVNEILVYNGRGKASYHPKDFLAQFTT